VKRKVGYSWLLRDVMARNRIYTATQLVPMLHDRGVNLSASQVHRLVSGTPERLSLQVLSALCDILECTPADLVTTTAENALVTFLPRRLPLRGCGPARPGSWTTASEPRLHRRAVRALVHGGVLPLRPSQGQGGLLA
jgi:DNA-binding Xre family transcriptional regulator